MKVEVAVLGHLDGAVRNTNSPCGLCGRKATPNTDPSRDDDDDDDEVMLNVLRCQLTY